MIRIPTLRQSAVRSVRPRARLPNSLRRGLVWAPDLVSLDDPISGRRGIRDGSTSSVSTETLAVDGATNRVDWPGVRDFGTVLRPNSGCAWIYPTTVAAGLANIFNVSSTAPAQSLIFRRTAAALMFTHASSATGVLRQSDSNLVVVDTWQFVWWTCNGTGLGAGIQLGIGAAEVSVYATTTDQTGTPRAADGLWSLGGRVESDANCFAGSIRAPMVWDRVLLPAEFAVLAGLPRPA